MSTSTIEIKKSAFEKNYQFLQKVFGDNVKISVVIKGNAYGHGIELVVPALESIGVDYFCVFSSDEAIRAFNVKQTDSKILIMGYICPGDFEWAIQNDIEISIYNYYVLEKSLEIAQYLNKEVTIHLDIETGMNRTGLSRSEMVKAVKLIKQNKKYFHVKGVSTHFAGAESIANYVRVKSQFKYFRRRLNYLHDHGIKPELRHMACSAAAMNYPESRMDMVRVGVLMYGYWPTKETNILYQHKNGKLDSDPLDRVIRWKSNIMNIRKVNEGEFVGYGLGYQAQQDMKIAIVPVGYSNGYSRRLSNNGHLLVGGQRADVIGIVNMNMTIIDISQIDNVKIGDEVILIGKQGDNEISFASFAEMNNNMNYDILSKLSESITRNLVN